MHAVSAYHRPNRALTIPRSAINTRSVLLLTLPALSQLQFSLAGQFLISDAVILLVFFALLFRKQLSLQYPYVKAFMLLWIIWFCMAVVSDLVNDNSTRNMMRGLARVGLFGVYIVTVFNLLEGKRDRIGAALVGISLGFLASALRLFAGAVLNGFAEYWKMGLGLAVMILLATVLRVVLRSRRLTGQIMLIISPINMLLQSRSLFLFVFLASLLSVIQVKLKTRQSRLIFGIVFTACIILSFPLADMTYDRVVRSGALGEEVLQKHLAQTSNSNLGVLLGGRAEILVSLTAVGQKPIMGHGSWAENQELRWLYYQRLELSGLRGYWSSTNYLIPAHSFLMGSWIEHGIAGASFWIFSFFFVFRAMLRSVSGAYPARPAELLIIIMLLWDILFSPFGAERRCFVAIMLAIMAVINTSSNTTIRAQQEKS